METALALNSVGLVLVNSRVVEAEQAICVLLYVNSYRIFLNHFDVEGGAYFKNRVEDILQFPCIPNTMPMTWHASACKQLKGDTT